MNREEVVRLHEQILYPVVRVRAKNKGGSGTVIYSAPVPDATFDEYETYVLTCHHVVEDLISVDKEHWDPLLKTKRPKEVLAQGTVEVFDYKWTSWVDSSQAYRADIVAYSSHKGGKDLAILRLDTPKQIPHVAKLFKGDPREIMCFETMFVSGCSMLHDPFASRGEVTYVNENIQNHQYIMANAPSVFGNSGGAAFRENGELFGVTARVSALQLGFSVDILTWMEFSVAPAEILDFIKEQHLQFLIDPEITSTECFARRKELQEEARHLDKNGGMLRGDTGNINPRGKDDHYY